MKNKLGLILLLIATHILGQQKPESLNIKLQKSPSSKDSIALLIIEGKNLMSTQVPENEAKGTGCYKAAAGIAKRIHEPKTVLYTDLLITNSIIGSDAANRYRYTLSRFYELLKESEQLNDSTDEAFALTQIGIIYYYLDSNEAYSTLIKSLQIYRQTSDSLGVAKSMSALADYYTRKNDYQHAVEYALHVINNLERYKNDPYYYIYTGNAYLKLGINNLYLGNNIKAIEYLLTADDLIKKAGAEKHLAYIAMNIAIAYKKANQPEKAFNYATQAYETAKKINDQYTMASCLFTLATYYMDEKNFNKAKSLIDSSILLARLINDFHLQCTDLVLLAEIAGVHKNHALSIKLLHQMLNIAIPHSDVYMVKEGYFKLSDNYENLADHKYAFLMLKKYHALQDSLLGEAKTKQIAEMQSQFEDKKKETEIQLLQKNSEVLAARIHNKNFAMVLFLSCATLIMVLVFLLLNRRNLKNKNQFEKKRTRQQRENALAVMNAQETERLRMAKEMHDGLGAYLSSVKMYLDVIKPLITTDKAQVYQNVTTGLTKVSSEIRTIAHSLVSDTLIQYGLSVAIEEVIEKLNKQSTVHFRFEHNYAEQRFYPWIETNVFRIVQELLHNAIRNTNATMVNIEILADEDSVNIQYTDNASGMDKSHQTNSKLNIRLKNLEARTKILNGSFIIDNKPGMGTQFKIEIPNIAA